MEEDELANLDHEDLLDQHELSEEQQEMQEAQFADVPYKNKTDSLYTLFNKVWTTPDSSKVGNLNSVELGRMSISVRDALHIAMLGTYMHHSKFSKYFRGYSEIISATSMAKKGWFVELFVSQKKYTARSSAVQNQSPQKKSWIFGRSKDQTQTQEGGQ